MTSRRLVGLCSLIAIAAFTQRCSSAADSTAGINPAPSTGGDSNMTSPVSRQANIHGNAMLGAVAGSHVTVYGMDPNTGVLDANDALGAVVTAANGEYNIVVDANALRDRPFALQMRGGTYIEEASGQTVSLGDTAYTTLLPPVSTDGNVIAALGPLPDMAYQLFLHQVATGAVQDTNVATLIVNASYQVSQAFGIPDVIGTLPADPNGDIPNDTSGQYTLILAAISHAAAQAGVSSSTMAAAFASTFAVDGNLVSLGNGNVTVIDPNGRPIALMPPSFATLQNTVTRIGNGNIVLPHLQPPTGFAPPTFTPHPPTVAPVGYFPGAPVGFDPNSITHPTGLPTGTPIGVPNPNSVVNPNLPFDPNSIFNPNTIFDPNTILNPNISFDPNSISNPNGVGAHPNPTPDLCTTLTYTNYGQAFFATHCLSCHAQGGQGFPTIDLTTFTSISTNQGRIAGQLEQGLMPRGSTLPPDVLSGILAWLSCPTLLR